MTDINDLEESFLYTMHLHTVPPTNSSTPDQRGSDFARSWQFQPRCSRHFANHSQQLIVASELELHNKNPDQLLYTKPLFPA